MADPSQQRFEHELLRRLAVAELPFQVPHLVPSTTGDTLRVTDGRLAALFIRIPGVPASEERAGARPGQHVDFHAAAAHPAQGRPHWSGGLD